MYSSRMRTTRSLTASRSTEGSVHAQGAYVSGGVHVCLEGHACLGGGMRAWGVCDLARHAGIHPPDRILDTRLLRAVNMNSKLLGKC